VTQSGILCGLCVWLLLMIVWCGCGLCMYRSCWLYGCGGSYAWFSEVVVHMVVEVGRRRVK